MNILNIFKTKLFEALLKGAVPQYFASMLLLLTKEMDLRTFTRKFSNIDFFSENFTIER